MKPALKVGCDVVTQTGLAAADIVGNVISTPKAKAARPPQA